MLGSLLWKFHCPVTFYKKSTAVKNLTAATSRWLLASLNFTFSFYRELMNTIFESYTVRSHVWKFHYPVTINKNSTAVTNLTAATSGSLESLNFTITFYRKMLKTIFEAYIAWNHGWKSHYPVTIYKNSTAVTNLTAATSRCLLASLNFPITFYRKMLGVMFENFITLWQLTKIQQLLQI